jgi:hypothetical protein
MLIWILKIQKMPKVKEIPFVRRFWSDLDKAKKAAISLWNCYENDETVFVIKSSYGLFGTIKNEFSLRLKSEGQRGDSSAIVHKVNYDTIKDS